MRATLAQLRQVILLLRPCSDVSLRRVEQEITDLQERILELEQQVFDRYYCHFVCFLISRIIRRSFVLRVV